ncbi:VCBS domain-containing protein, partial [Piscinibacter sp. Jin2]
MAFTSRNDSAFVTENLQVSGDLIESDNSEVISRISMGTQFVDVPMSGEDVSLATDHGTLTINRTGRYTFIAHGASSEALSSGQGAAVSFSYDVLSVAPGAQATLTGNSLQLTVTGSNDQPTVTAFSNGAVTEDTTSANLSTTVSANFNDIDTRDVLSYSQTKTSGSLGGTLTLLSINDSGFTGNAGSVSYTYRVANSATQFLALGQTATETFTITASDGKGGSVSQLVTVTVTGTNDRPTVTSVGNGAVTEDAASPNLSTTVSVNFNDIDTRDVLSYSQTKTSGSLGGTLSLLSSDDSGTTGNAGSVSYTYRVANSATQFLAAGQTATETFTITASDGKGGSVSQVVTVTVTGSNDQPTVTTFSNGAVTEDTTSANLSTTVSANFNDIDTRDVLSYSQTKTSGTLGGTLTLLSINDSGFTGNAGSVSYTYRVANSATQFLALGQTATETFTITASDGKGGSVSQLVTVTVTGTNDRPTVTSVGNGAVTEDAASPNLSTTVSVNFSDIDTRDVLSYSQTKTSGSLGGTLSLLSSNDSGTGGNAGSVSYTY